MIEYTMETHGYVVLRTIYNHYDNSDYTVGGRGKSKPLWGEYANDGKRFYYNCRICEYEDEFVILRYDQYSNGKIRVRIAKQNVVEFEIPSTI